MEGGEIEERCKGSGVTADVVILKIGAGPIIFIDIDKSVEGVGPCREDRFELILCLVVERDSVEYGLIGTCGFVLRVGDLFKG